MRALPLLGLALLLGGEACAATAPTPLAGEWGGDHVALTFTGSSARVEYDCAHGRVDGPLRLDANGRILAHGVHVRERGGPVREGDVPDAHPAEYRGRVEGRTLRLTVRLLDTGQEVGTFVLRRGATPRLLRCL